MPLDVAAPPTRSDDCRAFPCVRWDLSPSMLVMRRWEMAKWAKVSTDADGSRKVLQTMEWDGIDSLPAGIRRDGASIVTARNPQNLVRIEPGSFEF